MLVPSAQASTTTSPTPGPATNVMVASKTATEVTLTWRPPTIVVPPARYRVRYRPVGSLNWVMAPTITTDTIMAIGGLAPATDYEFEVLTNNGN